MSTSIPALLINSPYYSRSYARKGMSGQIIDASRRNDCWRSEANDEQAYHVVVRPDYDTIDNNRQPDFHATIYVNTRY